jgi:hypothetical protein
MSEPVPPPTEEWLRIYWELHEPFIGALLEAFETIREHFDDDGNLRGSGQWRLWEIYQSVKKIEAAEKTLLDETDKRL